MRKVITIVGVGNRREGTSKTGKSYDFTPISFTFEDDQMSGVRAEHIDVSGSVLGSYVPRVGDEVDVVFHYSNYRPYLDAVIDIPVY